MENFTPADVDLSNYLQNTFGCCEFEHAIELIVRYLQDPNRNAGWLGGYEPGIGWKKKFRVGTIYNLDATMFAMLCAAGWICNAWFPKGSFVASPELVDRLRFPDQEPKPHTYMSWSINITGTLSGVRLKVAADTNIPPGIKSDLLAIIDEPNARSGGITIVGSGHAGGGHGYINSLKTERVELALESAPLPEPAATESPAAPAGDGNPFPAKAS